MSKEKWKAGLEHHPSCHKSQVNLGPFPSPCTCHEKLLDHIKKLIELIYEALDRWDSGAWEIEECLNPLRKVVNKPLPKDEKSIASRSSGSKYEIAVAMELLEELKKENMMMRADAQLRGIGIDTRKADIATMKHLAGEALRLEKENGSLRIAMNHALDALSSLARLCGNIDMEQDLLRVKNDLERLAFPPKEKE